jgi:NADPH:quinone reductase-like Zn-dependent oxidoreductase
MRAVVLTEPGPVEHLVIRELPVPEPPAGWVRIAVRDLPAEVLQRQLDRLAVDEVSLGPIRVHAFGHIRQAHADMEQNRTFGKMVVTTAP